MERYIIECSGISKNYRWFERGNSLKESFTRFFKSPAEKWEWTVLKEIGLKVHRGERIGIIGKNGCGKSTLLKIIAGIHPPSSGKVTLNTKRLLALIELGAGFYPDLTGRENITLNWVFNGLPKSELKECFQTIVEFSGVSRFLDTPLKYYSSGMSARLGFAIAVHARPELLIIDEALAVGDSEFQNKCYEKIEQLCASGTTLMLVTHNMNDIEKVCSRGIWLDNGRIGFDGEVKDAVGCYMESLAECQHGDFR